MREEDSLAVPRTLSVVRAFVAGRYVVKVCLLSACLLDERQATCDERGILGCGFARGCFGDIFVKRSGDMFVFAGRRMAKHRVDRAFRNSALHDLSKIRTPRPQYVKSGSNKLTRRSRNNGTIGPAMQVVFVAMDDASFDFLDALSPGCAVLFPQKTSVRGKEGKFLRKWTDAVIVKQSYSCIKYLLLPPGRSIGQPVVSLAQTACVPSKSFCFQSLYS